MSAVNRNTNIVGGIGRVTTGGTEGGYVQNTNNGQIFIPNGGTSFNSSSYYQTRPSNLVTGSRVASTYLPGSQVYGSTKPQPVQVYRATGPPLPPPPHVNTQLESVVRPVSNISNAQSIPFSTIVQSRPPQPVILPIQNQSFKQNITPVQTMPSVSKQLAVSTALPQSQSVKTIQSTKYIDGPTVYETVHKEAYDSNRESRKKLYESSGYVDKKKGNPCCWALLGLLLLAGLLTGLYFLVRAISANAGPPVDKPADIAVNGTTNSTTNNTSNNSVNTTVVVPSGPAVIDVNTNPHPSTTTNATKSNSTSVSPTTVNATSTTGLYTLPPNYVPPTSTTNSTSVTIPATTTSNTNVNNSNTNGTQTMINSQLYYSDPNIQIIDKYLRAQDAYRLGSNPTLTGLTLQNINGTTYYYLTQTTSANKNYIYGVTMQNGQPTVQSVSITQGTSSTATTASHSLTVKTAQTHLQGFGLHLRKFSS